MPFSVHIIRTSDYLRCAGDKRLVDLPESRRILSSIAKSCVASGINCALLDVRDMTSSMQLHEMYDLAATFHEMGFKKQHRLAILHRTRVTGRLKFFAIPPGAGAKYLAKCAADKGWSVRGFDTYEKAMNWFSSEMPTQ